MMAIAVNPVESVATVDHVVRTHHNEVGDCSCVPKKENISTGRHSPKKGSSARGPSMIGIGSVGAKCYPRLQVPVGRLVASVHVELSG